MFEISIRADVKGISRKLDALKNQQVPFATVTAINSLAALVQKAERENMVRVLDRPTPFTLNSVKVGRARKGNPEAIVFVQDRAAGYLQPFEVGGTHKLIGKGETWLVPKNRSLLNRYGNFPANTLKRLAGGSVTVGGGKNKGAIKKLAGRKGTFIGTVDTRKGPVGGVWTRTSTDGSKGLKLLIRFGDAIPVRQHLDYRKRAEATVRANVNREFGRALAKALATARP